MLIIYTPEEIAAYASNADAALSLYEMGTFNENVRIGLELGRRLCYTIENYHFYDYQGLEPKESDTKNYLELLSERSPKMNETLLQSGDIGSSLQDIISHQKKLNSSRFEEIHDYFKILINNVNCERNYSLH